MSFSEIFRFHAASRPTKTALVDGDDIYSFRELDAAIDNVCHRLAERGVEYGDLVAVGLPDHAEHLVVLLALSRLGAVILPIDCRWAAYEKQAVIDLFGAGHTIVGVNEPDAAPNWLRLGADWLRVQAAPFHEPRVTPDTPLLLSLSSGTTGLPKGPRLTQRQFENRFMAYWINLGFNGHDRLICATPLYFGGGRGFSLAMLLCGGTVYLFAPPYSPEELAGYVAEVSATNLFLVPTLLRRMLSGSFDGLAFPSLRCLISSGSALYLEERIAIRDRLSPNLYELYASTEAGSVSALGPDEFAARPDSVGRACFRVRVEVVDKNHAPLPTGETGRLRYRSPASPASYYLGHDSEAFHDGWFYPGDLAMIDEEGYLFLRGRSKDMIIRGGINIYPGDIEQVILTVLCVTDVAVVGVPSAVLGEEAVAFVVAAEPDEEAIRAACLARLAPFKQPSQIRFVDSLPKNSLGKVLKADLSRRFAEEPGNQ